MLPGVGGTQHTGLFPGRLGRHRQEIINDYREDVTKKGQRLPYPKKYMIDHASLLASPPPSLVVLIINTKNS